MPVFSVFLTHAAEKGFQRAEPKVQQRLKEALDFLETNPVPKEHYDLSRKRDRTYA